MILIAHIGGVPFEELLPPLASGMTAGALVVATVASRLRRQHKANSGERQTRFSAERFEANADHQNE
jgi:uncharacterized protein YoaH (UPF0181 family)